MPTSKGPRETMPEIAGWIDRMREMFGAEVINEAIRAGLAGEPTFHAIERGVEIGTPLPASGPAWRGEGLPGRHFCPGCSGRCVGTQTRCTVTSPGRKVTSSAGAAERALSSDTDHGRD